MSTEKNGSDCYVTWGERNGIEFRTLTLDRLTEAVDVLRDGFFDDEIFCVALGITEDKTGQRDIELLCEETARDGISIMAVCKETDKLVGVCFNKFQEPVPAGQKSFYEVFRDTKCKSQNAIDLIDEGLWFDNQVDIFREFTLDCFVEISYLATRKQYRNRGIGFGVVDASLSLARTMFLPKQPPAAVIICSSPWTTRIAQALEFEEVVSIAMDKKLCRGKPLSEHPTVDPNHADFKVMVKMIIRH